MIIKAQRKSGLAERMAAVLGIPCERIQVTRVAGEEIRVDIGDMGPDGVFKVSGDVPGNKQAAAEALSKVMLEERG